MLEFSGFYILFNLQFSRFVTAFSCERRRRDLNPRAATNDLLPFQGSPFNHLGTSAWLIYFSILLPDSLFACPQRREWDSNPRALSDKRFSRPPRYDHFDTSPNFLSFHRLNCLVRPRDNVYSSIILSEMSTPFFHFFYFFVRWPLTLLS